MRPSLRAGGLLALGSLAFHELRYLGGYGESGATAVAGHGYLAWLAPLVALALAAACGVWLARIGRARKPRRAITWSGASASLALIYAAQETAEALAASGHPGLAGHGGWVALPLAVVIGGVIALLGRVFQAADDAATAAVRPWSPRTVGPAPSRNLALPAAAPLAPRLRLLAYCIAGRAPPAVS